MSLRLGRAIVTQLNSDLGDSNQDAWILIEGVTVPLASAISECWLDELPELFVLGPVGEDFDGRALGDTPPTTLRNRGPMCLVICSGHATPDSQSLTGFAKFAPDDLVGSRDGLRVIAEQPPSVGEASGVETLIKALSDSGLEKPPTALAVADLFDRVVRGEAIGDALPRIGAFCDGPECESSRDRIVENVNLAASRSTAERMRPSAIRVIRERAEEYPPASGVSASDLIQLFQNKDPAVLSELTYEEAHLLLEGPPTEDLVLAVRRELKTASDEDSAMHSEAARLSKVAAKLSMRAEARSVAVDLLEFDSAWAQAVFSPDTRRRLKKLARDKSIAATSIEDGLIRAIAGLGSSLTRIELKEPKLTEKSSDSQLVGVVSLAAARMRILPVLQEMASTGVSVPTELVDLSTDRVLGSMIALGENVRRTGKPVVITVHGQDRNDSTEVRWTPGPDEFALLSITLRFALDPECFSLKTDGSVDVESLSLEALTAVRPVSALIPLASELSRCARTLLERGYEADALSRWAASWSDMATSDEIQSSRNIETLHELPFAGTIRADSGEVVLTHLSPLKAEWFAAQAAAWKYLASEAMTTAIVDNTDGQLNVFEAARALTEASASGYPSYFVEFGGEQPLTLVSEREVMATFGSGEAEEIASTIDSAGLRVAVEKLVGLQPEAVSELKCIAYGDGAADLLTRTVVELLSTAEPISRRVEITCVDGAPTRLTLARLDELSSTSLRGEVSIRYVGQKQSEALSAGGTMFHLAVIEGVSRDPRRLRVNVENVEEPPLTEEVLFIPKTWVRPKGSELLLLPPALTSVGKAWFTTSTRIECAGGDIEPGSLRIPEVRIELNTAKQQLLEMHEIANWVVTVDRFATRASIRKACGGEIAIVHQERRVNGSTSHGLVISQKVGATADRAIERSLRKAKLVEETSLQTVARGLREAAVRAYGILALRAATTGSGINELIGHVAGFHRLVSAATPWPLPAGSRVILISLDEYSSWFGPAQRADMLALALSEDERGVYGANVEVKAVRDSSQTGFAMRKAKEQLKRTLIESRAAAYPDNSFQSRLWLNRIADAAIGTAREQGIRLSSRELESLESFRAGHGTLEWAAVGMVFAPGIEEKVQHVHIELSGDRVPIALSQIRLTADMLRQSAQSDVTDLRTIADARPASIGQGKKRRSLAAATEVDKTETGRSDSVRESSQASVPGPGATESEVGEPDSDQPPLLGWDADTGDEVRWHVQGPGALSNGHVEIYGTSGAGKTQFLMSVLAQMKSAGSHFGVCDFKNDYAGSFPDDVGAEFFDMWNETLPYNPLAIDEPSRRSLQGLFIELRDTVEIAAKPYVRLGPRQLHKLQDAFEQAYESARAAGEVPTLEDVHELLDDDLIGVIGDLTGTQLFGAGPPLGSLVKRDAVFGLSHIPGTGLTTMLASGFILSSLYLRLLEGPQVANRVSYVIAIDEAHRVANFHSVGNMVRELRSKGLAVILATQKPGDLPDEASTNAQTKIFLRLPDATSAKVAAKALDPSDSELPKLIRSLDNGEAFVSFAGAAPRLVRLRQFWRDG